MKHNETNGTGTIGSKPARTTIPHFRAFWLGSALAVCPFALLPAEEFGLFTYRVIGETIEIVSLPS